MINNRSIFVSMFTIFVMLAVSIYTVQPVQALEDSQIPELSGNVENVICDQPPSYNLYGGIGRSGNNPPNGTVIDQNLTNNSGRITATGVCGIYQYISGWWFNASEMANLPYDSIMYGASPYTTSGGGAESGAAAPTDDNDEDRPPAPVSEIATVALVSIGTVGLFFVARKYKKN
jgi:hypothetical protein